MKYKTCVSIGEKNPKKLKIILNKALSKSDFAEIRFDYLKKSDIPIVLENSKKSLSRCVCTLRPKSEGGLFMGKEDERKSILRLIAEYNPFLLDVEFNTIQKDKKLAVYLKKTKCKHNILENLPWSPIQNATILFFDLMEYSDSNLDASDTFFATVTIFTISDNFLILLNLVLS